MQASLASSVMSTLITNRLRCAVAEALRELKKKSIAPCGRRDGDGKRKKPKRASGRSAREGETHAEKFTAEK